MDPNLTNPSPSGPPSTRGLIWVAAGLFVVIAAVGVWSFRAPQNRPVDPIFTPGSTPGPWQYDPANNQHWNPLPRHNHWHTGPPPPEDQRQEVLQSDDPGANSQFFRPLPPGADKDLPKDPKPWQYDSVSDTHYDPRPDHMHWHQGPPPPEDQRK